MSPPPPEPGANWASGEGETRRFFRWAFPAATAIALIVGGLWWTITIRQVNAPVTRLRDGAREILLERDNRTAAFAELPPAQRAVVREMLHTATLPLPADEQNWRREAAAPNAGVELLSPQATAVRNGRPAFSWKPRAEASSYRVTLAEATSGDVLRSEEVSAPAWTPAEALPPDQKYRWQVTALRAAEMLGESGPGHFEVISMGQLAELEEWERLAGDSHLLRVVALARAGLREEAAAELEILARDNPESAIVRALRAQAAITR